MYLILIFALLFSVGRYTDLTLLGASTSSPWWTLLTCHFMHLNLFHLLSNSILAAIYIHQLRRYYNPKTVIPIIVGATLLSTSISIESTPTFGASSIICAMIGVIVSSMDRKHLIKNTILVLICILITYLLSDNINSKLHITSFLLALIPGIAIRKHLYATH